MKKIKPLGGTFNFHINSKISYIEQDLEFPNLSSNAANFVSYSHPKMSQRDIRTELAKVGIKNELAIKSIGNMSGGEQVRVKLCSLSQNESNILILDEPTNHLDVLAKQALMDALIEYPGAIILVTHEPGWAERICNLYYDIETGSFGKIDK